MRRFYALVLFLLLFATVPAHAQITWEDLEVVDTPIEDISSSSGVSVLHHGGLWHVVYVKSGQVFHRARSDTGWLGPFPVPGGSGTASTPHLAAAGGFVHVVWEGTTLTRSDVWTSRFDGSAWSLAQCLTNEGPIPNPAGSPVVGGEGGIAYAAWEEELSRSISAIRGRRYEEGTWGPIEVISEGAETALEPSVSMRPGFPGTVFVVWSDARHGDPEIYARVRDGVDTWFSGWSDEVRLTDMAGSCRRPSVHSEDLTSDVFVDQFNVVFENDQLGMSDVYGLCYNGYSPVTPQMMSLFDGVPSVRPNLSGFRYQYFVCDFSFGNGTHVPFVTWTNQAGASAHQISNSRCSFSNVERTATDPGISYSAVGAIEGEPEAELMLLWVTAGPTLVSRLGRLPGVCRKVFDDPPPVFVIGPEGNPSNTLRVIDSCTGSPEFNAWVLLDMDPALEAALNLDPASGSPPYDTHTDANGFATFSIRGGGCSQAGPATAECYTSSTHVWPGIKSPDVNGDCVVDETDVAYVSSVLGTNDFCGDLDGSGQVTAEDVSIVSATLGEECTTTSAHASRPRSARLSVTPVPARTEVTIRFESPVPGPAWVRIIDVSGRVVRDLGIRDVPAGTRTLHWDLRDDAGQRAASGRYFAVARLGDTILRHVILLLH